MRVWAASALSRGLFGNYFSTAKPKRQKTLYQILEVPSNATSTTIKKNYLKLAKIYHPDVYKGADKNRFQKIQQAYKTLSSQKDRLSYDSSIGIRTSDSAQYDKQPSQGSSQSSSSGETNEYGKKPNDFAYAKAKMDIDIEGEYEKFFKKKSTTNFEEIRLHEQTEFKAMSENERVRRRFSEVYTDPNAYKMQYKKSYGEVLDDQISQKNTYEEDEKRRKKQYEQKYSEQGIKRHMVYIKLFGLCATLALIPVVLSFGAKLRKEREIKEKYESQMDEVVREMQLRRVRGRMKFE